MESWEYHGSLRNMWENIYGNAARTKKQQTSDDRQTNEEFTSSAVAGSVCGSRVLGLVRCRQISRVRLIVDGREGPQMQHVAVSANKPLVLALWIARGPEQLGACHRRCRA